MIIRNKMEEKQQLDIELNHEVAQGTYANLAIISHSTSEFIVDFVRIMPGIPKAEVKSRIILTPNMQNALCWRCRTISVNSSRATARSVCRKEGLPDRCSRSILSLKGRHKPVVPVKNRKRGEKIDILVPDKNRAAGKLKLFPGSGE